MARWWNFFKPIEVNKKGQYTISALPFTTLFVELLKNVRPNAGHDQRPDRYHRHRRVHLDHQRLDHQRLHRRDRRP